MSSESVVFLCQDLKGYGNLCTPRAAYRCSENTRLPCIKWAQMLAPGGDASTAGRKLRGSTQRAFMG